MPATIDHLRADHHVEVIQAFTDLRGITHHVGDTAIIRAMGLDTQSMEIWIDWECGGVAERLHFALRATTGPGNGRMRDFFAVGNDATTPAPFPSGGPNSSGAGYGEPPTAPAVARQQFNERTVTCECDVGLHRPVLTTGTGVHACMRCGTLTYTQAIGDDGRHTGNVWTSYVVQDLPKRLSEWLARWPRVTVRHHDLSGWSRPAGLRRDAVVYLPAQLRFDAAAALNAVESTREVGVHSCEFPTQPPPEDLPAGLWAFGQFSVAARLTPRSPVADLIAAAQPHSVACALAVAKLLARRDAEDIMMSALRSDDPSWQGAGAALALAATPTHSGLPDVLCDILLSLPVVAHPEIPDRLAGSARWNALLAVIAGLALDTPVIRTTLPLVQRRVARLDSGVAGNIGEVLRAIHGLPPGRVGYGF